jgi:hypothetical protein
MLQDNQAHLLFCLEKLDSRALVFPSECL